ncbi:MAG: cell division protein ZapA [Spirochaetales bacterium]|nr:cell division protein ZapA [Spirochaetales bacterium]
MPDRPETKIDILGTSFSVHTDEEPEYLGRIIEYYREKTEEIRRTAPSADALKSAILAGIILADELFKLKDNPPPVVLPDAQETARITEKLIRQLSDALDERDPDYGLVGSEPGEEL